MSVIFAIAPRMMDTDTAAEYVGGPMILADLEDQKLLKPRTQRKKLTRYDRLELDAALDRWEGFK